MEMIQLQPNSKILEKPNDGMNKLKHIIDDIASDHEFIDYFEQKKLIEQGNGYMSSQYTIDLIGTNKQGKKELNLFAKIKHDIDDCGLVSMNKLFSNECFAYTDLFNEFNKLQREASISKEDFLRTVKCYYIGDDTIIMENMIKKGFEDWDRMKVVTLEYAELAIKEMSKLHSLSFALQKKRPEYFETKMKSLKMPHNFKTWSKVIADAIKSDVEYCKSEEMKLKLSQFIPKFVDGYSKYFGDTDATCGLCHGDFRPNNMLTKTLDGKLNELVVIDYQFIHYSSLMNDLLFFIFLSTDQEFRRNHLEYLKEFYHQQLTVYLQYHDINVNEVYPKETFDREFKERLDFGLMASLMMIRFILAPQDDVPDITQIVNGDLGSCRRVDEYFVRMNGVIDDFINWGYL